MIAAGIVGQAWLLSALGVEPWAWGLWGVTLIPQLASWLADNV